MKLLKRLGFTRKPTREPSRPPSGNPWDLDNPLLYLSPADPLTIRSLCEGVQVFGGTGSGKTSGSGAALARAFLRAGFGGLVMCAKPEERRLWERYAREAGREQHLVILSPDQPWRFNFLDYERSRPGSGGGQTENIVELIIKMLEIAEGKQQMVGGDQFWTRAMKEMLRNAISLLTLAGERLTLDAIARLISEAPQEAAQLDDEAWRDSSFCAAVIARAETATHTERDAHDFHMGARYWLQQFPALADRTRTSIVATYTSVADVLLHGIAWELFGTSSNLVPEITFRNGAIIILDLPIQEYFEVGRICQGIVKYMFQRAVLQRNVDQHPRPVFLWADESQNFVSSYDFRFQAVARSARACTVYLTQNISNYYSVLGAHARDEAHAMLGNLQTKIFHANSDHPTNQYAAEIIGQAWTTTHNYSTGNRESSGQQSSAGGSESVQYKVLPSRFTTLRTGGPHNGWEVDALVFQGGRVWQANGDTWLPVVFRQQTES